MFKRVNALIVMVMLSALFPMSVGAKSIDAQQDEIDLPTTGFENSHGEDWTSLEEEIEFLREIEELSDRVRVTQEGSSVLGKPIHLIRVGDPLLTDEEIANGRNIFIMGTPHGNEPAGREMSLLLIRELAFTEDPEMLELLSKSTLLFAPTPNPDGREANRRTNDWGLDNNRDNLNITSPENEFIAGVLNYFSPDLTIDLHERPSGSSPDIEALWPRNLNVDNDLRELNITLVEDYVFPAAIEDGWTTGVYGRPGGAGGEDERILRNLGALRHGLTLLTESAGQADKVDRVAMQRSVTNGALQFYLDYFDDIKTTRDGAKERRAADGIDPSVPFYLDGADNWEPTMVLENKPMGYLLTDEQTEAVSKHLELFSIASQELPYGTFIPMNQPMMTVIPLLFDGRAKYYELETLPLYSLTDPGTVKNLREQVEHFNSIDAFSNQEGYRKLIMHLHAVEQFEASEDANKVTKHLESFKLLLDYQYEEEMMTAEAYDNLLTYTDFLLEKWQ